MRSRSTREMDWGVSRAVISRRVLVTAGATSGSAVALTSSGARVTTSSDGWSVWVWANRPGMAARAQLSKVRRRGTVVWCMEKFGQGGGQGAAGRLSPAADFDLVDLTTSALREDVRGERSVMKQDEKGGERHKRARDGQDELQLGAGRGGFGQLHRGFRKR